MGAPSLFESPFVIIIFGATGDLARNKLLPALFSLYKQKSLPEKFYIVGFARRPFSNEEFANMQEKKLTEQAGWTEFSQNLYYQQGEFSEKNGYEELIKTLTTFDTEIGACITRIFYLATPPDNYEMILEKLVETKLSDGCGPSFAKASRDEQSSKWTKLAIEKPFGKDLETAKHLDQKISEIFEEKQIFRVDHYLGKDTVQNMIAFRFANSIFEPVWNREYIDHIQITWAEEAGIGTRGKFFDGVGMLRDVAQNHLLQLLASVAMEQPKSFSKEGVRDARANAIKAVRSIDPKDVATFVVRGQYAGYKNEKDVAANSETETFVGMKVFVDTPRFMDVPFYLRAGKKMEKSLVEISVVFKQTCHILFKEFGCPEIGNVLTFTIQPNEGIKLRMIAKQPGAKVALQGVNMHFSYEHEFGRMGTDAYEKLLLDILAGDQMLFNRTDELESSWQFITNILKGWSREARSGSARKEVSSVSEYKPGSWGPKEGFALIEKDGRKWM